MTDSRSSVEQVLYHPGDDSAPTPLLSHLHVGRYRSTLARVVTESAIGQASTAGQVWYFAQQGFHVEENRLVTKTGYYGHVAITVGSVRGMWGGDPVLEVELKVSVDGFAPGVAALILCTCLVQGPVSGNVDLGQAETLVMQLGFARSEGGGKPFTTRTWARWRLSPSAVEHLELIRAGGDLTLHVTPEVILLNSGQSLADVYPAPAGVARPNVDPHCPIWHGGQEHISVTAETWAHQVLVPWQQAAAVTVVVKLPTDTATDGHRTVIRDLTDARQRMIAGDWKGSVRASRDAVEVLRGMYKQQLNTTKTKRTIDEREAAVLDAEISLIQALYDYDSATHPDEHLRTITWTRQHAVLALSTAAAVAGRLFSEG